MGTPPPLAALRTKKDMGTDLEHTRVTLDSTPRDVPGAAHSALREQRKGIELEVTRRVLTQLEAQPPR